MVDENVMSKKFMSFIDKQEIKWFELFYHIYNNKNKNILSELYTKGIKIINLFNYNTTNKMRFTQRFEFLEVKIEKMWVSEWCKNINFGVITFEIKFRIKISPN